MKKNFSSWPPTILVILVLLFSAKGFAQNYSLNNPDPFQLAFTSSDEVIRLNAVRLIPNDYSNINGSSLLYLKWSKGIVNFRKGTQLRDADLQFDLVKNEVYFKRNNKANLFVEPVASFILFDTTNGITKVAAFKNGYPDFGMKSAKSFYLILTFGPKLQLLKYISKNKTEVYEYNAPSNAEYRIKEDLFVYNEKNKSLQILNRNISSIKKVLSEYNADIQQWLQGRKGSHFTDEELIDLINQLNNL